MIHDHWQQYLQQAGKPEPASAGLAYLPELAAVRFSGADVRKFLQGYLTCDTDDLRPDRLIPTALCNLKGRVVMNGWCAPLPEHGDRAQHVVLVLHASLVERLAGFLDAYLKFSRTTLTDLRPDTLVFGSLDLEAAGEAGGLPLDGRRCLFLASDLDAARELWVAHPHLPAATWLAALTADGIPLVSTDVSETFLPQMLDLQTLGAINFAKGCYLGQEVVARAQHRGQVKRRLARLRWQGARAPLPGAEITDAGGRPQGVIVQSATDGSGALLAVLSRDAPQELRHGDAGLIPAP